MDATVSLNAAELNILCSTLSDLIIAGHPDAEAMKPLWEKLHGAWGQQILAPAVERYRNEASP
jgi:hypothetical protein